MNSFASILKKTALPKKPFKSFSEYSWLLRQENYSLDKEGQKVYHDYPCLHCRGRGKVYPKNAEPDVIEGYKLIEKVACSWCGGSGEGSVNACIDAYNAILEQWQRNVAAVRRQNELLQNIATCLDFCLDTGRLSVEEASWLQKKLAA